MTNVTMKSDSLEPATDTAAHFFDHWFDPIESGVRERVREFIEALICGELDAALARHGKGGARGDDPCPPAMVAHRPGSGPPSLPAGSARPEITWPPPGLRTPEA